MDLKYLRVVALVFILYSFISTCKMQTEPTVQTDIGIIQGISKTVNINKIDYDINVYLGIPYAKAPVGERRFRKPEPVEVPASHFKATKFGYMCPQPLNAEPTPVTREQVSEDCLFLNIFAPDQTPDVAAGYPVMVFLHGGGMVSGAGDYYTGTTLAAYGSVIVVTINYRLGFLGFASTGDDNAPGNMGLWDQHMALKWINQHIQSFGGDNSRVTLFGQSAGASSVSFQTFYPGNEGLLHRAIQESGNAAMAGAVLENPKVNIDIIANEMNCSIETTTATVECLRKQDIDTILTTIQAISEDPEKALSLYFAPVVDGDFIKQKTPLELIQSPIDDANIPKEIQFQRSLALINGVSSHEGGLLLAFPGMPDPEEYSPTREEFRAMVEMMLPITFGRTVPDVILDMVMAEYTNWDDPNDPGNVRDEYVQFGGDSMYVAPTIQQSRCHANISTNDTGNSYMYRFSEIPTNRFLNSPSWLGGANHGDELGFVFGFNEDMVKAFSKDAKPLPDWETQLSYIIMTYWTNFAKTGNPNSPVPVAVEWPSYTLDKQQYIDLNKDMSNNSTKQYLGGHRADFWLNIVPSVLDAIEHAPLSTKDITDTCINGGVKVSEFSVYKKCATLIFVYVFVHNVSV